MPIFFIRPTCPLSQANRPYSALQVFENLHERVKKGQVAVILDQLSDDGLLVGKLYGKSKVYHTNQDMYPVAANAAGAGAGAAAGGAGAQARAAKVKEEHDALTRACAALEATPETDAAAELIATLTKEVEAKRARKLACQSAAAGAKATDVDAKKKTFYKYFREWRLRRKACLDMMDLYLENVTKTRKAFMKELGVETDEEFKVDVKEYGKIAEQLGCHKLK
jgi:26S proteasome regulatory subunit (ATPase 3-interacting protein)